MRIFTVTFLSVLVGALCYTWEPEELQCLEELKIEKALIEDLNDPTKKPCPEDNEDLKNFLECSWKKNGMLDQDNEINWERVEFLLLRSVRKDFQRGKTETEQAVALVMGGIAKAIIDRCHERNIRAETPGLTIVKIQNCLGDKIRALKSVLED
ncbi:hypothetical protein ILUMI_10222 [Ignelater luminosus]|uniref:Uncharacterized protein n=1 Tax=Ignelater luminosus TaxID=2038154 RepID=A0A8K0CYI9_IGNLU|nr:hypothetical protein ILUMI_10222 [Ignelater luminosus]